MFCTASAVNKYDDFGNSDISVTSKNYAIEKSCALCYS